jgi:hypothetical protein
MGNYSSFYKDKTLVFQNVSSFAKIDIMDIQILKSDVMGIISEESAYKSSHATENKFDKQFIKVQDWTYIGNHWTAAKQIMIDVLKKFLTSVTDSTDGDFDVSLTIPNFDSNLSTSLTSAINRFIINYLMCQWMIVNDDEDAKEYDALYKDNIQSVKNFIYSRTKPTY